MKLVVCPNCSDVFSLRRSIVKVCHCGASGGVYLAGGIVAEIYGDAVPIGFGNGSLLEALNTRPNSGNGREFKAFVIPVRCPTVEAHPERNPVAMVRIVGKKGKKKEAKRQDEIDNRGVQTP